MVSIQFSKEVTPCGTRWWYYHTEAICRQFNCHMGHQAPSPRPGACMALEPAADSAFLRANDVTRRISL